MPNEKKLKARILELGLSIKILATEMNLTPYTLGQKIAGKAPMTLKEARYLKERLQIADNEVVIYFFISKVA